MQTEKAGGTGINGRTKSPDKWAMPAADYVKIKFDGPFSTPHKKKKSKIEARDKNVTSFRGR